MKRILLFLLSAASTLAPLHAGVQATVSANKPERKVVIRHETDQETNRSTTFYRGTGEFRHIGQAFKVEAGGGFEMAAVTFRLHRSDPGVAGKRFSIRVYRMSAPNQAPDPDADLVSSQEGVLPGELEEGDYLTLTLDEPVPLDGGQAYLILFAFEEPTSADARALSLGLESTQGPAGRARRVWALLPDGKFSADHKSFSFFIQSR